VRHALFGILAEGLADRFEPALCEVYADLFAPAIPGADAARYRRVRVPARRRHRAARRLRALARHSGRRCRRHQRAARCRQTALPERANRLRRPSEELRALRRRPAHRHAAVSYRRGTLADRLAVRHDLEALFAAPDALVIDSDSRLTQLGLLPVCPEDRYHLFESRAYGGTTDASLPQLAAAWAEETFGVTGAKPYIALAGEPATAAIAVSLGVGENPAKRIPIRSRKICSRYSPNPAPKICIDKGAGGEEAARVERAVARSGIRATFWEGSFAGFAAIIAAARLYVGYDSAGQHVAAAAGVPLGEHLRRLPAPRMFHRWRPNGNVIRVDNPDPAEVIAQPPCQHRLRYSAISSAVCMVR
jgi:hypothetical protein